MFCTYCKAARPDTEAPCPNCGAPSPWQGSQNDSWGTPQLSFDTAFATNNASWQQTSGQWDSSQAWQQPSGQPGSSQSWQQTGAQNPQEAGQQNRLPVPYEGGTALEPVGRQSTISLQLVPEQAISHLLPAEPLPPPDTVHITPMYTKPRSLIPKRRIINGLLSVIVVTLLLCSGAGYYAKVSGIWDSIVKLYPGNAHLSDIAQPKVNIPDPPAGKPGPAQQYIPSVATALQVDPHNQVIQEVKIFKPGQIIQLSFSVQPAQKQTGEVIAKWYTNDHFYTTLGPKTVTYDPTKIDYVDMTMRIDQPASGRVELYWNGQLAQTYYFAVRD